MGDVYIEIHKWRNKAEEMEIKLRGGYSQEEVLREMEKDYPHYMTSLQICKQKILQGEDTLALTEGLGLVGALARFWWMCGYSKKVVKEVHFFISKIGEYTNLDHHLLANAYYGAGMIYYSTADYPRCREVYLRALNLYTTSNYLRGMADTTNGLGMVDREQANYPAAREKHEFSLKLYTLVGDEWGCAHSLSNLGVVEYRCGQGNNAKEYHEKALHIRRKINDSLGIGSSLGNLAALHLKCGEYTKAKLFYEEALNIRESLGDKWGVAGAHVMLGTTNTKLGQYDLASKHLSKCLTLFLEVGDKLGFAETMEVVTSLLYKQQHYTEAVIMLGAAEAARERIKAPLPLSHVQENAHITSSLKELLGDKFNTYFAQGKLMSEEESLTYASKCCKRDVSITGRAKY